MAPPLPGIRLQPAAPAGLATPSRRSFLRYTGASAALGSIWLASCSKKDDPATPAVAAISSFSPASGMVGTVVTITGTNLTGATAVLLGSTPTTFTVVNATTITFTVPAAGQTGAVTVTTPAGTVVSSTPFTVTATPATAPTVVSFTPTSALPGATVTVTGTNFTGATTVTVAGIAVTSFVVVSATSLTFVVPSPAVALSSNLTSGIIYVVTPAGNSGPGTLATAFTILPTTVNVGTGDVGVLNYAYALEQLEAAFYTQVRTGTYYTGLAAGGAEKQILDDLYYHEVIHRDFFRAAITAAGATPLMALTVNFTSIDFSSRTAVLNAAKSFEDLGVAAYNGAARYITAPAYLFLAGKIVSVEARHAALIRDLLSEGTFVGADIADISANSLEISKLPAVVVAVANTYLATGSKLDVSGLV